MEEDYYQEEVAQRRGIFAHQQGFYLCFWIRTVEFICNFIGLERTFGQRPGVIGRDAFRSQDSPPSMSCWSLQKGLLPCQDFGSTRCLSYMPPAPGYFYRNARQYNIFIVCLQRPNCTDRKISYRTLFGARETHKDFSLDFRTNKHSNIQPLHLELNRKTLQQNQVRTGCNFAIKNKGKIS